MTPGHLIPVLLSCCLLSFGLRAQSPALVGYWHNWDNASAPFIPLNQVDSRYNVIMVAFATPVSGSTFNMTFTPYGTTQADFIAQIQALKAQGKRVGISVGGGGTTVQINNQTQENTFVSSMLNIINTYGFDAMDLDLEGSSLSISGGTIANPVDVPVIRMINATRTIMSSYRAAHSNQKLFLTMAPETAHTIGGQSAWGGVWGSYLPVVHALRDSLDIMMVQLYNSGSMYGVNGGIYNQGTADFIVALGEAMILGFNVDRWSNQAGPFVGLPAHKIAIGLPACTSAAGGGYTAPAVVKSAIDYLRGTGPKPGSYTRISPTGYPDLRGMMTWSVNWDAVNTCGLSYEFASSFETIFLLPLPVELAFFKGVYRDDHRETQLTWATLSSTDLSHFEVEHSHDGEVFEPVGHVEAQANYTTYDFVHHNPMPGMNYYRLQQVDYDGQATYSHTMPVWAGALAELQACPNPCSNLLAVTLPQEDALVQIFDVYGKLLLQQEPAGKNVTFDLSGYPAGLYCLVGSSMKKWIVKQ